MEKVYGPLPESSAVKRWSPAPYADYKSRYLWTDAYGVCNFLTAFHETGERRYLEMADQLITDVHNTLGRDRRGHRRLAGATDERPTLAGLRIGKVQEEGSRDGDGQYFHYLTKWAFALNRMSIATQQRIYNDWAVDLLKSVHPRFVHARDEEVPRMYWKISVDMSRPWVVSEGNLDPFDGYVTYRIVNERAKEIARSQPAPALTPPPGVRPAVDDHSRYVAAAIGTGTSLSMGPLEAEILDMRKMVQVKIMGYHSTDPLDLGESLWVAHFFPEEEWSRVMTGRALQSLELLWKEGEFHMQPSQRLAFRELGTTIGVQVVPNARTLWMPRVAELHQFWEPTIFRRDSDITPVMFASSLIPGVLCKTYVSPHARKASQEPVTQG
jgi:hypothetical protein